MPPDIREAGDAGARVSGFALPCLSGSQVLALPPSEEEGGASLRDGFGFERKALGARRGVRSMATAVQKITLSPSRDIPFKKLVLSRMSGA